MEVINMSRMFDGSMAAASAMFMTVVGMGIWGAHKIWGLVNTKGFCQMRVRNRSM
jgi:hypothetical protein